MPMANAYAIGTLRVSLRHALRLRQSPAVGKPYQERWTHMLRLSIKTGDST
jgi:hypothetical protein